MKQSIKQKNISNDNPFYEHLADDPFYLFLSKEDFLFDEPHYHESIEITYIIRGKTTVHLSGQSRVLEAGDIFISNRQQAHFYENYDNNKLALCVLLSTKYTHDFREVHKNVHFPSFLTDRAKNQEIYALMSEWLEHKNCSFLVHCAYANLLLDKIITLYGLTPAKAQDDINKTAIQFINYIAENYHKDLSLDEAANHFGYSKEYFSKKFKQAVGKNFLTFLNTMRLQKAVELLHDPERKLTFNEICSACGFNNTAALYRHLKRLNSQNTPQTKV